MSPNKDLKLLSLIEAVRSNENLYDFRQALYKDENLKSRTWEIVAFECDYKDGAEAKQAWNGLYASFMKFYRNEVLRFVRTNYEENEISLPQEQTTDATSKWDYYSDMHFIAPFRDKNSDPELERLIELAKPIVLRKSQRKTSTKEDSTAITIAAVSASAETQTPAENLLMDIPAINEENMTEKEKCLRSFFDAVYRATLSLPVWLQNQVKRKMLESLNKAEILAVAEKRAALMEEGELEI